MQSMNFVVSTKNDIFARLKSAAEIFSTNEALSQEFVYYIDSKLQENKAILDPKKKNSKGRPPSKRLKSQVEIPKKTAKRNDYPNEYNEQKKQGIVDLDIGKKIIAKRKEAKLHSIK